MPDTATLPRPAVGVEPSDKRTNAWKEWAAKVPPVTEDAEPDDGHESQEWKAWASRNYARQWNAERLAKEAEAEVKVEAPKAEQPAAPDAPIDLKPKIKTPDEFCYDFMTRDPAAMLEFARYPNPVANVASAMRTAYQAYLLNVSPKYAAWFAQSADRSTMGIIPKPGELDRLYVAATKA